MSLVQKSVIVFIAFLCMLWFGYKFPSPAVLLVFTLLSSVLVILLVIMTLKEKQ